MRQCLFTAALLGLALLFVRSSMPQAASGADRNTPEALKAAYDQAKSAKDWPGAVTAAQKLVDLRASAENLDLLATAQIGNRADADALTTTDRALETVEKDRPAEGQPDTAWKDLKSKILLTRGNAYLRLRRNSEAIDAYNQSAALASDPVIPLFNVCATYFNGSDWSSAIPACRKAVQADPTRANAWFLLGSALYVSSPTDSKANSIISDECRKAMNKYLELAPDGPHAADVKAMLEMTAK